MSIKSNRGGSREGSGRPKNSGKYRELTRVVRIPESCVTYIKDWLAEHTLNSTILKSPNITVPASKLKFSAHPLFSNKVSAGFPSPADDHIEQTLDLNEHLIKHPAATFFVRVEGDSMIGAGIHEGDILIVDRSLEAKDGKVIIAVLNGELTVKRLKTKGEDIFLMPENPKYSPIKIKPEMNFHIWGVVSNVIHTP